mmetsp:Transcript_2878/g.13454  ORF Transcript_2878/g.13454 Transcript_2878/m.13454 type:complete len:88 (-) Transcript_2878:2916-3179(-)
MHYLLTGRRNVDAHLVVHRLTDRAPGPGEAAASKSAVSSCSVSGMAKGRGEGSVENGAVDIEVPGELAKVCHRRSGESSDRFRRRSE